MSSPSPEYVKMLIDQRVTQAAEFIRHLPALPNSVGSIQITFHYDDGQHLEITATAKT
jgi:hypothetical protein